MKSQFACLLVFALASCSSNQHTGASVDALFRDAVSPDAQTLISVDLAKIKSTEIYRRHQQLLNLPQFDNLAQRAGLDPRRDVSSLLLVWDGKHVMVLAHGDFNKAQLEQKLAAEGAQRVPYKNFTLLTRDTDSVAFLPGGLAVASSTPAVQAQLDRLSSHSGRIPEELEQRLSEVPSDAQIWVVSRGGIPAANFQLRSDLDSLLSNFAAAVSGTSLGVRFDSGFHLLSRVICKSPEGAQRVNDSFRGLIGLARLSTKDNELDLLRMWDAISISKDQQFVRVQADLPADLSDQLIDKVSSLRGQLHPQ